LLDISISAHVLYIYNKMDKGKPSTGEEGIPGNWVIYKPEEPLYETLYTCICLSEIRDMAEQGIGGAPEEEEDSGAG
jgi:hypothetical protein